MFQSTLPPPEPSAGFGRERDLKSSRPVNQRSGSQHHRARNHHGGTASSARPTVNCVQPASGGVRLVSHNYQAHISERGPGESGPFVAVATGSDAGRSIPELSLGTTSMTSISPLLTRSCEPRPRAALAAPSLVIELAEMILDHTHFLQRELQQPTVDRCSVGHAWNGSHSCSGVARKMHHRSTDQMDAPESGDRLLGCSPSWRIARIPGYHRSRA